MKNCWFSSRFHYSYIAHSCGDIFGGADLFGGEGGGGGGGGSFDDYEDDWEDLEHNDLDDSNYYNDDVEDDEYQPLEEGQVEDPEKLTRRKCDRQCNETAVREDYPYGLVVDYSREEQDWNLGCLCYAELPTIEEMSKRCSYSSRERIFDYCGKLNKFETCFDAEEDPYEAINYWTLACVYDLCQPPTPLNYIRMHPRVWGPWCTAMEKLELECRFSNPSFPRKFWKSSKYCKEYVFEDYPE